MGKIMGKITTKLEIKNINELQELMAQLQTIVDELSNFKIEITTEEKTTSEIIDGINIEGKIDVLGLINKLSEEEQIELGKKIIDLIMRVTRSM